MRDILVACGRRRMSDAERATMLHKALLRSACHLPARTRWWAKPKCSGLWVHQSDSPFTVIGSDRLLKKCNFLSNPFLLTMFATPYDREGTISGSLGPTEDLKDSIFQMPMSHLVTLSPSSPRGTYSTQTCVPLQAFTQLPGFTASHRRSGTHARQKTSDYDPSSIGTT